MGNSQFSRFINGKEIRFIDKQVSGYEWLAVKKGAIVYVFSDDNCISKLINRNKQTQQYFRAYRREIKQLIDMWKRREYKGENNGRKETAQRAGVYSSKEGRSVGSTN